jgi:hypothetical protein
VPLEPHTSQASLKVGSIYFDVGQQMEEPNVLQYRHRHRDDNLNPRLQD